MLNTCQYLEVKVIFIHLELGNAAPIDSYHVIKGGTDRVNENFKEHLIS